MKFGFYFLFIDSFIYVRSNFPTCIKKLNHEGEFLWKANAAIWFFYDRIEKKRGGDRLMSKKVLTFNLAFNYAKKKIQLQHFAHRLQAGIRLCFEMKVNSSTEISFLLNSNWIFTYFRDYFLILILNSQIFNFNTLFMNFSYRILKFPRNKVVVMHHLVKVWKSFMMLYVKCHLGLLFFFL